jgi:hypothetical protein
LAVRANHCSGGSGGFDDEMGRCCVVARAEFGQDVGAWWWAPLYFAFDKKLGERDW